MPDNTDLSQPSTPIFGNHQGLHSTKATVIRMKFNTQADMEKVAQFMGILQSNCMAFEAEMDCGMMTITLS